MASAISGKLFGNGVDGRIVIFGNAVARHDGSMVSTSMPADSDGVLQTLHHGDGDRRAGPGLLGNDDRDVAPAIREQVPLDLLPPDAVVQADRRKPAIRFLCGSSPFQYQTLSFLTGLTSSSARPLAIATASTIRFDDLPPPGAPKPADRNFRM